jgi:hypothetical protein
MKTVGFIASVIILLPGLLYTSPVRSQDPEPIWKYARATTAAEVQNMLTDSVGNCYVTGIFRSNYFRYGNDSVAGRDASENSSAFIMKTNPTGKLIYLYSIYCTNLGDNIIPVKMQINQRGEAALIFTAEYADNCMFGSQLLVTNPSIINTIVAKITKNGRIAWTHQLVCDDTVPVLEARDLFVEEAGDVYLTGYFNGSKAHLEDHTIDGLGSANAMLFVARIGPDGSIIWFRNCPFNAEQDDASIYGTIIRNAPNNNFYIGGYYDGYRSFYFGPDSLYLSSGPDAFIAAYTKDGTSHWARSIRGDSLDIANEITVLTNGDPVLMGYSNSYTLDISGAVQTDATGLFNIYLARYDLSGNYINSAKIGIQVPSIDWYNPNAFMGRDQGDNLIVCSNFNAASVFSGAFTLTNAEAGTSDMLIARLDNTSLVPVWTNQGTATGDNRFEGVHIGSSGEVWFSGSSFNNLNVDSETIVGNTSDGSPYLVKINAEGSKEYTFWQMNTVDKQLSMNCISVDKYGNAYLAGNYWGPENVIGTVNLTPSTDEGVFLAKYSRVKDVSGLVINSDDDPVTQCNVKIYGYTYFQRSPLNDSIPVGPDGSYHFTDIPYGEYLLLAQPKADAAEVYVSTYFPSAVYWEFGEKIIVNTMSLTDDRNIIMQENVVPEGITLTEGNVSFSDNPEKTKSGIIDKGRPTKKATVVLAGNQHQKSTYEVVATTETDDNGNFAFYNIDDGSYYLWVDYPGLPVVDAYYITITGNQYVSSLDYLVNEETVTPAGFPNYSAISFNTDEQTFLIYPNPANDFIHVILRDHVIGMADIINSEGTSVMQIKLTSSSTGIDLTKLKAGNYIVRLVADNSISYTKITIIR